MIEESGKRKTLTDFQDLILEIYGVPDDQLYSIWDLLSNQERFAMRMLKGIRKNDLERVKFNLIIATAWFFAIANRFHLNLEKEINKRFPYCCPYCENCPCKCKHKKPDIKTKLKRHKNKPKTLAEIQEMFEKIYPVIDKNLEHIGIHLAEEQGEISEAMHLFAGTHQTKHFKALAQEMADYFSHTCALANKINFNFAQEFYRLFPENCHVCHKTPCICNFY